MQGALTVKQQQLINLCGHLMINAEGVRTISVILFLASVLGARAQRIEQAFQKVGFAEGDYIVSQMPEFKKTDTELQGFYDELQKEMKLKTDEFQAKLKSYNELPAGTPSVIKLDKEKELAQIQRSLEKFKADAQTSFQKKRSEMLDPLYRRIGSVIEQVAVENGYAFIINQKYMAEGQVLLSWDEKYNISDLVLRKLGVVPVARKTLKVD
jgi:outer membrane protein